MNELHPTQLLELIAQIQRMEPGKVCIIGQGPNGPCQRRNRMDTILAV